jgi:hypothetical protein
MIMYETDDNIDYDRNHDHDADYHDDDDDDDDEDFYHRYSTLMIFTTSSLFNTIYHSYMSR